MKFPTSTAESLQNPASMRITTTVKATRSHARSITRSSASYFTIHCSLFTIARLRFAHNTDATVTDLKKTKAR